MMSDFINDLYDFNEDLSIWTRQNFQGIRYSDGDEVERRIASIIKDTTDLSVLSDELRPHCTDWPTTYHLSATRANILRPFEQDLQGDILEIGAGCGAITRYLGECGGQVLALEGTPRRASIARARTFDLDNVTVVSDKFDDFKCNNKFDVVTLIGVLEYANLFTDGENPATSMLERVKSFLKPNGKLYIAIENQLGLKYFASAQEDHVGIPMYGVEARYRKDQPQTYGRKHLHQLIKDAGFSSIEFLAPFPDYKLPASIVTEKGFLSDDFDSAAFACQSVRKDPQLPKIMAFSPEMVWPSIVGNGLSIDLSNSFLIVAAPKENEKLFISNTLAWHFTTERRKELCKLTEFKRNVKGEIDVCYKRLHQITTNPIVDNLINNYLPKKDQYRFGEILSNDLIRIISCDGWKVEEVSYFLSIWLNYLSQSVRKKSKALDLPKQKTLYPGEFFDYIPQNIIRANDGALHVIDKEWILNDKIEIDFLLFRVLWSVINSASKFGKPENLEIKTYYYFIYHCMRALGWIISDQNIKECIELEYRIQSAVAGRPIDSSGVMDWLMSTSLPVENLSQAVEARDSQIISLSQAVGDRETQIASLSQAVGDRDSQIVSLSQVVGDHETQIANVSQAVGDRDSQIVSLCQVVGDHETQIASLIQAVGDRESQIVSLSQVVGDHEKQIDNLSQAVGDRDSQIASLSQVVGDRETQIASLSQAVGDRDGQIVSLSQVVGDRETQIASLSKAVGDRDSQIARLSQVVADRETQIASLSQAVGDRDSQIVSLSKVMGDRETQIVSLYQAVGDRETQIARLSQVVADREIQIDSLSQAVGDRDSQIVSMSQVVGDRETQIVSLYQAVGDRETQIASLSQAVVDRNSQIASLNDGRDKALSITNQMLYSKSWRFTRPLRFVARLARYGLTNEDLQVLRMRYHRLPLPTTAKRLVGFIYHKLVGKVAGAMRLRVMSSSQLKSDLIEPSAKADGLPDYIVWGVIDWHFRHQRPQQIAVALAATGRRIFYITPNFTDDERAGFELEELDEAGLMYQIKLFVKSAPVIYSAAPSVETIVQLRESIGEMLLWANSAQTISLVDHPFWYDVASVLPNSRMIYDCMDHHEGFGNNAESLVKLEKTLLSSADLTITTSKWLDDAVAPHAMRRALIRNAGDYSYFSTKPLNVYRDPQDRQIIGYYGAIAEWFDLDLIEAVAKQHPECCVLLIGADTVNARARLNKLSNVTFTGEVPYRQLTYYLYGFDVCLLPFKVIPLTLATNPVKVYEYLSAGKPVVAIDLPEMLQFKGLVYAATDKDAFLAAVNTVLSQPEPDALVQRRKIFAQGQTWQHRAEDLVQQAESAAFDPQVSVVVITYNNLEFTRACLASLDEYSQYENIEIIVVDNASSDGSPEFLSEWVAGKNNRKLILNEENRGFAAANNQGLEIATGDYLVLLNNDTYVTPGWIRTLVRHLERDKKIGLIGPVTNNIGNEARIDIAYSNMEEMLQKSADYTHRHLGQIFTLKTAAFFCVMMPRTTYSLVGKLDEVFGRGFFEDDDYCRRIEQHGLSIICAEDIFVHHHLSASFNKIKSQDRQKLFEDNKATYEAKWGKWVPHSYKKTSPAKAPSPFET
jgi:GT2 family glycosyltransferase/glycosyltransferase involved in cell wall biosynthesis/uncharacterized protein (DUF3084 family)/SAM-dependent methyltransferase